MKKKEMIPSKEQKMLIAKAGYEPNKWNVVNDESETMMIINKSTKQTEIIKK